MGTTIKAIATSRPPGPFGHRSLRLADRAARTCLKRGSQTAEQLDMLINAGVYREDSLGEPALAALIQDDIGADPRHPPAAGHGTFSFDIANGACGVLTGAYLLDGFMRSRVIQLGMTVTSDVKPSRARAYPFPPVGGALLLGWDDTTPGFAAFQFDTFPEYAELFEARLSWEAHRRISFRRRRSGRNRLTVREAPDYAARCVDCTHTSVQRFLRAHALTTQELDLIVANQPSPEFPRALADRLGLAPERVASPTKVLQASHSAGLLAALEVAHNNGQLQTAHNTLLVAVGAGIAVALALYRQ